MDTISFDTINTNAEGLYNVYFDEMPCFVTIQDREMRVVDCNRRFRENFGDRKGDYCWEVYKGRMSKCPDCAIEKTFLTGESQQSEEIITNLKGEDIPVNVYTSPIINEQGQVDRVLEISTDISGVKNLQKKLHKAQHRIRQLFDEVPCYVTVQNRDLIITAANRRFKDDFGEGVSHPCFEAYKHRSEPCLECPVAKTFEDGQTHHSEEVVTSMSGEQYNVLVSTSPLRDSSGEIFEVVEMSTNITQIRKLQDQLTSLGLLVGSISHGIKGLISHLDGAMYMMTSGLKKNDQARIDKGWDIVQRNVNRIKGMVHDILYYAKDRELQYETVDIQEFMSRIATVMTSKAAAFKVDFNHDFESTMGEFQIDPTALQSALINILENSFDACRKDLKKPAHQVSFNVNPDQTNAHVVIDIEDNGIGMDRETQDKIFSLFFSSKGIEGTGLGLYIANKIVRKHGGTIKVKSAPGEGTHFRITLPKKTEIVYNHRQN
ncbi:ATP-binding protein [candidate division CSSED10-310 bacterium]|uniref:histidine kinase n=1 Tax=candidate division CSSED10-310 bacterium TaxID=2855610 RepID=A0ABV6Z2X2_UNCC1